jgi:hypothetical protein
MNSFRLAALAAGLKRGATSSCASLSSGVDGRTRRGAVGPRPYPRAVAAPCAPIQAIQSIRHQDARAVIAVVAAGLIVGKALNDTRHALGDFTGAVGARHTALDATARSGNTHCRLPAAAGSRSRAAAESALLVRFAAGSTARHDVGSTRESALRGVTAAGMSPGGALFSRVAARCPRDGSASPAPRRRDRIALTGRARIATRGGTRSISFRAARAAAKSDAQNEGYELAPRARSKPESHPVILHPHRRCVESKGWSGSRFPSGIARAPHISRRRRSREHLRAPWPTRKMPNEKNRMSRPLSF